MNFFIPLETGCGQRLLVIMLMVYNILVHNIGGAVSHTATVASNGIHVSRRLT